MAASIPIITTTAINSISVKPPSSALQNTSIRHEHQEDTFLPLFLHAAVATGLVPALRSYSAVHKGIFSQHLGRRQQPVLPRLNQNLVSSVADRIWRLLDRFSERSDHQGGIHRPLCRIRYWRIAEMLTSGGRRPERAVYPPYSIGVSRSVRMSAGRPRFAAATSPRKTVWSPASSLPTTRHSRLANASSKRGAPVSPFEYGELARVPFSGCRGWVNFRARSS